MKISDIRRIDIDGEEIKSANDFHDAISEISKIDGYGRNLDALYDVLTSSDDLVVIHNADLLKKNLGAYAEKIFEVFDDASKATDALTIIYR